VDAHTRAPALQLYVAIRFYFVVLLSKLQTPKIVNKLENLEKQKL
jgi:hypothetical protein